MEGIPLWHERDISHSSTERIALPDASIAHRLPAAPDAPAGRGLVVDADRMRANLESTGGLVYTSAVLLELVGPGCRARTRTPLTQAAAMETWQAARRSGRRCGRTRRRRA